LALFALVGLHGLSFLKCGGIRMSDTFLIPRKTLGAISKPTFITVTISTGKVFEGEIQVVMSDSDEITCGDLSYTTEYRMDIDRDGTKLSESEAKELDSLIMDRLYSLTFSLNFTENF
jgi:hypothetical protein